MKAESLLNERHILATNAFVELRVWRVQNPVRGSVHDLKYSLALIVNNQCVLRYDNEAGKGDHRHFGEVEVGYTFTTMEALIDDFWKDVDQWWNK